MEHAHEQRDHREVIMDIARTPQDRTRKALLATKACLECWPPDEYGEDYGDLMHSLTTFVDGALRFIENQGHKPWSERGVNARKDLKALEDLMLSMNRGHQEPIVSLVTLVQFWEEEG